MRKRLFISLIFAFYFVFPAVSQQGIFSIATDLGLLKSFKKNQRFLAGGQTVHLLYHLTPKDGPYFWFAYYSAGKFSNNVTATAKSIVTIPQQIDYVNRAQMRFKQMSVGWKRYIKGTCDTEENWNLYATGGFGVILGSVSNTHSAGADTSLYNVPVLKGRKNFKRLTLDLGFGWETNLGGAIFFYNDVRVWIPTTDYPSKYLFVNRDAPFIATLNFGIRILFD